MFLKTDEADLLVQSFGSGPRTLVTHGGWVGSGELWLPVVEHMPAGWRTVIYDHRGTGATINRAPHITFERLVEDLFLVLDRLGIEECILAGESAGTMVVLEAASRQPRRFCGLVLVGSRINGAPTPQSERLLHGCRADFAATMSAFVDACVPEADCAAERAWGKKIVMRSTSRDAVELMACLEGHDFRDRLPDIRIPTLVLHGSDDRISPLANAELIAATLPGAELAVADGAGHVPTVTRPQWIASHICATFGDGQSTPA